MIYILSDKKIDKASNIPLLQIDFIYQNIDFSLYDGLIVTSKNAAYSLNNLYKSDTHWQNIPVYAIAKLTAQALKDANANVVFVGNSGHGNDFARELLEPLKNKKVLYLRGEKVVSNLVSILNSNDIVCDESIIYGSSCRVLEQKPTIEKNSTIIFSSPSTIECFFKNFTWDRSYKAISIGKTTASYLPKNIPYQISPTTSLKACVDMAINKESNEK